MGAVSGVNDGQCSKHSALHSCRGALQSCRGALQGSVWRQLDLCRDCVAKMQMQLKATRWFTSRLPTVRLTRCCPRPTPGLQEFSLYASEA